MLRVLPAHGVWLCRQRRSGDGVEAACGNRRQQTALGRRELGLRQVVVTLVVVCLPARQRLQQLGSRCVLLRVDNDEHDEAAVDRSEHDVQAVVGGRHAADRRVRHVVRHLQQTSTTSGKLTP